VIRTVDALLAALRAADIKLYVTLGQQIRSAPGDLCPICALANHGQWPDCRFDAVQCLESAGRIRMDPALADRISQACDGTTWDVSLRLRLINRA
jgi:hypothetical protein